MSLTVINRSIAFDPALFDEVMVNTVDVTTAAGVPVSSPEVGSIDSPAGSGGLTEKLVASPPVTIGVIGVMVLARTKTGGS